MTDAEFRAGEPRRVELIERSIRAGLTPEEEAELSGLNAAVDAYLDRLSPPLDVIRHAAELFSGAPVTAAPVDLTRRADRLRRALAAVEEIREEFHDDVPLELTGARAFRDALKYQLGRLGVRLEGG
jgi:hypothetical protein